MFRAAYVDWKYYPQVKALRRWSSNNESCNRRCNEELYHVPGTGLGKVYGVKNPRNLLAVRVSALIKFRWLAFAVQHPSASAEQVLPRRLCPCRVPPEGARPGPGRLPMQVQPRAAIRSWHWVGRGR